MSTKNNPAGLEDTVNDALRRLDARISRLSRFPENLEARFEADTRRARSHRMWLEGLFAILGLNACLLLDYAVVRDVRWIAVVLHTAIVTPLALAVNLLIRRNPVGWVRESSVAAVMITICLIDLFAQGDATVSSTLFGSICVLITGLFVGVVMRLRAPYVAVCLASMLVAGLWFLRESPGISPSEAVVGGSLMVIGLQIILVASFSLEREERRGYLLCLQRDLQADKLARTNKALEQLSSVDNLTGLPNRRALEERFERMWRACAHAGDPISAVVIDVDHFKMVNDAYGHLYGDEALRRIGTLLPQALRSSDDMAARFGGEEFVLLLAHADRTTAATVAERARQLVETAGTPLNGGPAGAKMIWITVSCGVSSCLPRDGMDWTTLVAAADEALYMAKHAGRNCVKFRECDAAKAVHASDGHAANSQPEPVRESSLTGAVSPSRTARRV